MSDLIKDLFKIIVYISPVGLIVMVIALFYNPTLIPKWFIVIATIFYAFVYFKYRGEVKKVK